MDRNLNSFVAQQRLPIPRSWPKSFSEERSSWWIKMVPRRLRSSSFSIIHLSSIKNWGFVEAISMRPGGSPRPSSNKGLREKEVKAVVSTNALELGIDIGDLEVCLIAGYPGTVASTYQQAGRVGRRSERSLAVLIARSQPLDQFIIENPDYFFGQSPEHGLINPAILLHLLGHIQCAAFELPFRDGEHFGREDLGEMLKYLEEKGTLTHGGRNWNWRSG